MILTKREALLIIIISILLFNTGLFYENIFLFNAGMMTYGIFVGCEFKKEKTNK